MRRRCYNASMAQDLPGNRYLTSARSPVNLHANPTRESGDYTYINPRHINAAGRGVPGVARKPYYTSPKEVPHSHAHPLLEMCKLMLVRGLGVHIQDLINVCGYTRKHWNKIFSSQREVLRAIVGEDWFDVWEGQMVHKLKDRLKILRTDFPPPAHWDQIWDDIEMQIRRDEEIVTEQQEGQG